LQEIASLMANPPRELLANHRWQSQQGGVELGLRISRGFSRRTIVVLTRIAATVNVSLCGWMKSWRRLWNLKRRFALPNSCYQP